MDTSFRYYRTLEAMARVVPELNVDLSFGHDFHVLTVKLSMLNQKIEIDSRAPDELNIEARETLWDWINELE